MAETIHYRSFNNGSEIYGIIHMIHLEHLALARKQFGQELKVYSSSSPITILSDNQSALNIAENPVNYCKAKYIDIQYHAIHYYLQNELITVDYMSTNEQAADIFTKPLGPLQHNQCMKLLGLRNLYEQEQE